MLELVESNAGIGTVLLLVVCAVLGFVVYDRLGSELEAPRVDVQSVSAAPLPATIGKGAAAASRLAAIDAYAEIIERPLFRKTRRPPEPEPETVEEQPVETPGEDLTAANERYVLIGVIMTPGKNVALLKDLLDGTIERVVDGQRTGEWSVAGIRSGGVSLRRDERVEDLELLRGEMPLAESETRRKRAGRRRADARQSSNRNAALDRKKVLARQKALRRQNALQRQKARERKKALEGKKPSA